MSAIATAPPSLRAFDALVRASEASDAELLGEARREVRALHAIERLRTVNAMLGVSLLPRRDLRYREVPLITAFAFWAALGTTTTLVWAVLVQPVLAIVRAALERRVYGHAQHRWGRSVAYLAVLLSSFGVATALPAILWSLLALFIGGWATVIVGMLAYARGEWSP